MMEKMIALQQKRRSKKGGFTLVELIVVLVILAILAALLIPALTGYIDKAKNKKIVAECRQSVMAAQTLADEEYGKTSGTVTFGEGKTITLDKVEDLAEVPSGTVKSVTTNAKGQVTNLEYKNGKTVTYTWADGKGTYSDPS
ncbi:prepilin-type N-terminal cleavage/methylation domain-containing protein [Agathobaculum butyriciproducens]|uniref:Prepilin-type N-terminal cleavage/methylation domain-containing protein n=1 Tax=Agathobaculum butyriciproducens TaxID=1628085 RepID=A0AAW4VXK2_9FIRM|nr:prepilin-type N-terminal cleavage/methylation domain-containing protein [Agathobaculum butyriciproducens]